MRINADSGLRDDGSNLSDWFYAEFHAARPRGGVRPRRDASARAAPRRARPAVLGADADGTIAVNRAAERPSRARRVRARRSRTARASRRSRHGSSPSTGSRDWSLAKRKAARQLMLPEREALPADDEIEAALAELSRAVRRRTHDAARCGAARGSAALDAASREHSRRLLVGRRGGRLGDRAQRHSARACRRRREGRWNSR